MSSLRSPRSLVLLTLLTVFGACRPSGTDSAPGAYVEDGHVWAYGRVEVADLDAPGGIMVRRAASDQNVDTPTYRLFGAAFARSSDADGGEHPLDYVDLHPTDDVALAYVYELDFEPRSDAASLIDVFAVLTKGGRSDSGHLRIYLGTANLPAGADQAALTLADGLKLGVIADGAHAGDWALYLPDLPKATSSCADSATLPGLMASQDPTGASTCRAGAPAEDLCGGDPTASDCRPAAPYAGGSAAEPLKLVTDLTTLSADEGVYKMETGTPLAKIVFQSATLTAASDTENAQVCARVFFAVGRTVDRQVNQACVLKPAPADLTGGKLTCALTIAFDRPQTYLERACDVVAVFRAPAGDEVQHIQVLKK